MSNLTKQQILDLIKMLSAIESWSFSVNSRFPDYLGDNISESIDVLTKELLGDGKRTDLHDKQ